MVDLNYIKSITIQNFQSHQLSKLEFDKGLNVIVGPSDQGKSAIIRAAKWVLFNEPRGSEFIRHGESFAKVTIEMNNGYIISRERSSSKNRYTLTDSEGNINTYEGFGNDVPEEIKKAHGINKVMIDTDSNVSLNLGEQLEGPFLVSETGAVRAKAIGRLTGVHVIDKALRDCISDIKKENQNQSRLSKEVDEIKEKLESYKFLDELNEQIIKKEEIQKKVEELVKKHKKITEANGELGNINKNVKEIKLFLDGLKDLTKIEKLIIELKDKSSWLKKLQQLINSKQGIDAEIKIDDEIMKKTTKLELLSNLLKEAEAKINKFKLLSISRQRYINIKESYEKVKRSCEKLNMTNEVEKCYNLVSSNIEKLNKLQKLGQAKKTCDASIAEGIKYIEKTKNEIIKLAASYEKKLREISKCPLCFSNLDEDRIGKVLEQYREKAEG